MADLQSLIDKIYYDGTRYYTHKEGNVAYLETAPLKRPLSMPHVQKLIALAIVVAAIIISGFFINNTVLAGLRETAQAEQAIAVNLSRQPSIDTIPIMADVVNMDNDTIRATFNDAGFLVYDASDPNDPASMVLYKLPADITVEDATGLYAKGVGNLTATQATRLLNGSWYFSVDRSEKTSIVVRYADFTTADPQAAIQSAIKKEGFDPTTISESGTDESGNTFSSGAIDAGGTPCIWKISALPLADMYSISGMPENACYVGVRITAQ